MNDSVKIINNIIENMEQVIVGKRESIEMALMALLCDGHVLIEDIPGVGKTSLVSALAKSVDCSFSRIQFTPDILPSDVTGFSMYDQRSGQFVYQEGAVMSNLVLADEINRTSPKTQSSLLEVMAEKQVTIDGKTRSVPRPFMVVATQNPIEYLGTFPLPEAQLDRFFLRISMGYPSVVEECEMLVRFHGQNPLEHLSPVATGDQILQMQEKVKNVYISDILIGYIVMLVSATRNHASISLGASPRSSIALMCASQAWAFYQGRDYVLPDDIQKMLPYVLGHRLKLKQEAVNNHITPEQLLAELVETISIPRGSYE